MYCLQVCLNAVAVLFLMDVDDLIYNHAVDDEHREEMEKHGRVKVDRTLEDALVLSRILHGIGVTIIVLVWVALPSGFINPQNKGLHYALHDILIMASTFLMLITFAILEELYRGSLTGCGWQILKGLVALGLIFLARIILGVGIELPIATVSQRS